MKSSAPKTFFCTSQPCLVTKSSPNFAIAGQATSKIFQTIAPSSTTEAAVAAAVRP
jgi:hypothetical protein